MILHKHKIMNQSSLVSIIVPVYNQKYYLDACLKSIANQTYRNIEVIIVNDGSTDDTPTRAQKWVTRDPRFKMINKKNEGTSFARRDGYISATGDYLTFVDNDDLMPRNAIETMVNYVEEYDVDMVIGAIIRKLGPIYKKQVFGSFPINEVVRTPRLFDDYYVGFFDNTVFPINIWGRIYRKSVVDKAFQETELFSPEMPCMAGDEYFNVKLFPYLTSMYRTDKPVYYYRYGGTVDHYNRFFPEIFVLSEKRLKLLDELGYDRGYRYLFEEYVNCVYYHASQMMYFNQTDREGILTFFKQDIGSRNFTSRLIDFYKDKDVQDKGTQLLISNDYEGMYNHAVDVEKQIFGSARYKVLNTISTIMDGYHKLKPIRWNSINQHK